jgi:cytochrome c peroxidase
MKTYKYILFTFLLVGSCFTACKKDPAVVTKPTVVIVSPSATPYSLVIPKHFPQMVIPGDNPLTNEGVSLGRLLFYDSILSNNYKQSCGSCHIQKFAFADKVMQFSIGTDGSSLGNKNAPAIFNKGWDANGANPNGGFFWDGRAVTLETQAPFPIHNPLEMDLDLNVAVQRLQANTTYPALFEKAFGSKTIEQENIAKAIAQFVRTITSATSLYDSVINKQIPDFRTDDQKLGFILFFHDPLLNLDSSKRMPMATIHSPASGVDCGHCHASPLFTPEPRQLPFLNNGLSHDSMIKVPSLRNVALTAPYMHDGRFPDLDAVLAHYDHSDASINSSFLSDFMFRKRFGKKAKMNLQPNEIRALKAFLATLNDYTLTTDPKYSNPFKK